MSRHRSIDLANGFYHVTARGDRRETIFADNRDRHKLIATLSRYLPRYDATAYAYCLMDNHYHLVLHTRHANLSKLMSSVNGGYAQAYNRRHQLAGHVFQGPFHGIHVDRDAYFLAVCRYVEMNPVRAGLVADPGDWPWSSWRANAGHALPPSWLDSRWVRQMVLGCKPANAEEARAAAVAYREYSRAGADDRLWARGLQGKHHLGDAGFVERVKRQAERLQDGQD